MGPKNEKGRGKMRKFELTDNGKLVEVESIKLDENFNYELTTVENGRWGNDGEVETEHYLKKWPKNPSKKAHNDILRNIIDQTKKELTEEKQDKGYFDREFKHESGEEEIYYGK